MLTKYLIFLSTFYSNTPCFKSLRQLMFNPPVFLFAYLAQMTGYRNGAIQP